MIGMEDCVTGFDLSYVRSASWACGQKVHPEVGFAPPSVEYPNLAR